MSLIDMSQFHGIELGPAGDVGILGRDQACDAVEDELRRAARPGEIAVALRTYGHGCVAVGLAGPVDRAMARRFGTLLHGLRPFSTRELLLTLARLGPWDPRLARVVGRARVHRLIDGGRLDLRGAPPELLAALDTPVAKTTERPAIPADLDREPCLEEWGLRW